jgi:hypothetical protein
VQLPAEQTSARQAGPVHAGRFSGCCGNAQSGGESGPRPARTTHAQATADFDGDRWSAAPEAVAYDMADELIGGPAGAPESGTSA